MQYYWNILFCVIHLPADSTAPFIGDFLNNIVRIPKTKEISADLRNEIVEAQKSGKGYSAIENMFHISTSMVRSIIRQWKEYQTTVNLPRTGASKKISTRASKARKGLLGSVETTH